MAVFGLVLNISGLENAVTRAGPVIIYSVEVRVPFFCIRNESDGPATPVAWSVVCWETIKIRSKNTFAQVGSLQWGGEKVQIKIVIRYSRTYVFAHTI